MPEVCISALKACRIRIIRNDSCGRPIVGPKSVITSKGFTQVGGTAEIEDGEEFLVKNACGEFCINQKDKARIKRYNLNINFCLIDFDAVEVTSESRLLTEPVTGDPIGVAMGGDYSTDDGYSLELWQKVVGPDSCEPGAGPQKWLYWAWPDIERGTLGDLTFENGPFQFTTASSTRTVGDGTWGTDNRGPFQVFPEGAGLLPGEQVGWILTDVQPPEAICGAQPLVDADPVEPGVQATV